ncbi:hypothetical protein [Xenorhabdus innexi]|uniref:Uncharacterized protein n=1 Tax=Xenorhabdus innexi TaxID=290109 RepID=A0A2G0N2Z7_9GAMM|nr:hypothetical protein [Xenorhabdus innexi]PHM29072.1 hypothetical protein Xinn_03738 [Xenorhabdus innexi]
MKNRRFERNRHLAKQYHQNKHSDQFEEGILIRYDYTDQDPNGLSWWDDVMFIQGKVRVAVAWQHPRQAYHDKIEDAAFEAVDQLYQTHQKIKNKGFLVKEKTYKKVGQSRKKTIGYTMFKNDDNQAWLDALNAEKARLCQEANFIIHPSFKIEMLAWCRYVHIVAPIEVRNVEELRKLAHLVRRLLKRETMLDQEFPDYTYGKTQWVADGLTERN